MFKFRRFKHVIVLRFRWFTIVAGHTKFKSFGIGFSVDRWSLNVDFGLFWIGVEW